MPKKTIRKQSQKSTIFCYNSREKIHPRKSSVVGKTRFTTIFTTTMGKVVPFFAKLCPFLREQVKRANPQ